MAFRSMNIAHIAKFNSATSSEFLSAYETFVNDKISAGAGTPHKTFAPSSFRCNRRSWFRLRGTTPDTIKNPDPTLQFTADVGTACHRIIQSNLKELLKDDWIDVKDYMSTIKCPYEYVLTQSEDSLETQIEFKDPPIRFACDGILRWNGKYVMLEIKTSEFSSWNDLCDPKEEHIDQIKCYATLLQFDTVLVLYQERQYGGLKCYEMHIKEPERDEVINRMRYVQDMVKKNLAPEGLPVGDKWCSENYCPYYKKCQEYGR